MHSLKLVSCVIMELSHPENWIDIDQSWDHGTGINLCIKCCRLNNFLDIDTSSVDQNCIRNTSKAHLIYQPFKYQP